jgi:hypothetical protein
MSLGLDYKRRVKKLSDIPKETHWQIIGFEEKAVFNGYDHSTTLCPEIYIYTNEDEWLQDVELLARLKIDGDFRAQKVEVAVPEISITVGLK